MSTIGRLIRNKRFQWGIALAAVGGILIVVYVNRRRLEKTAGNIASIARATTAKYSKQFINYLGQVGQVLTAPRGVRNNNPGNINATSTTWNGKVPATENTDGRFEQFYEFPYGVRALILNLKSYFKDGKNTVRKIIETWAPAAENGKASTEAYVQDVAKKVGVKPDTVITFDRKYIDKLVKAIGQHENGESQQWISDAHITKAWSLIT
ncbi:MAG: hypothetical protein PHT07_15080 [Paludibacter sp.]|nr:hypothetical protein [Paludibacter sp.]